MVWEKLQEEAMKKLENTPDAHPDVKKHWRKIASGRIPFGYRVVEHE